MLHIFISNRVICQCCINVCKHNCMHMQNSFICTHIQVLYVSIYKYSQYTGKFKCNSSKQNEIRTQYGKTGQFGRYVHVLKRADIFLRVQLIKFEVQNVKNMIHKNWFIYNKHKWQVPEWSVWQHASWDLYFKDRFCSMTILIALMIIITLNTF